jgi:cytochrome c oxidase assembly protein Cox11
MRRKTWISKCALLFLMVSSIVQAGTSLWTFNPQTATTIALRDGGTATVQYQVTNQSSKTHTLTMQPIQAVTQDTTAGFCSSPFVLKSKESCLLSAIPA